MKISEFFKFTWGKAILGGVLFVLFAPAFSIDSGIRCITEPCEVQTSGTLLNFIFGQHIFGVIWISLILGLVISYLVSCFILFLYTKVKEKHK